MLAHGETHELAAEAFARISLEGKKVLVIIPDGTRTAPVPLFFRLVHEFLAGKVAALDYLVALGTHQPLSEAALNRLVGVTAAQRQTSFAGVNIFNHRWDRPEELVHIGTLPAASVARASDGLLALELPVTVNRLVMEADLIIICGPVFPHEVVGFSGGNKYFFPGVGGPEVTHMTHWLGALLTSYLLIGRGYTPVRALIDQAAALIPVPKLCFCPVVVADGLAGLYMGSPEAAWQAAAELSKQVHIVWVERPFQRVLSVMPEMYDDLWTAAKGMYKLEPAVADGGELVIYGPHIDEVSYTHGRLIDQIGYHVRDYFVEQWDHFKGYPWGVLAHSTHLCGVGSYDARTGVERPRIQVSLATGISQERCERLGLGYVDPKTIRPATWQGREEEGVLMVPKAGEMLYRLKEKSGAVK